MRPLKHLMAGFAAAATLIAFPAVAQPKPPIKVGAILPMTGPLGAAGLMFGPASTSRWIQSTHKVA